MSYEPSTFLTYFEPGLRVVTIMGCQVSSLFVWNGYLDLPYIYQPPSGHLSDLYVIIVHRNTLNISTN